jgi:hypothetical protein
MATLDRLYPTAGLPCGGYARLSLSGRGARANALAQPPLPRSTGLLLVQPRYSSWLHLSSIPQPLQAPTYEEITVQQLIHERPEGVLRYLQRSGVKKLGEFCMPVGQPALVVAAGGREDGATARLGCPSRNAASLMEQCRTHCRKRACICN